MKEDVRITKTKRDLRAGLASLLKKMPLEKITVCNVCEESLINRMTFYKHYMDKHDLLNDLVKDVKEKTVFYEGEDFDGIAFDTNPSEYISKGVEIFVKACNDNKEAINALAIHDSILTYDVIKKNARYFTDCALSRYGLDRESNYDIDAVSEFLACGVSGYALNAIKDSEMSDGEIKTLMALFSSVFTTQLVFKQ